MQAWLETKTKATKQKNPYFPLFCEVYVYISLVLVLCCLLPCSSTFWSILLPFLFFLPLPQTLACFSLALLIREVHGPVLAQKGSVGFAVLCNLFRLFSIPSPVLQSRHLSLRP